MLNLARSSGHVDLDNRSDILRIRRNARAMGFRMTLVMQKHLNFFSLSLSMIEDIFDQACTLGIDRLKKAFRDDERLRDVYEHIATPIITHVTERFSNIILAVEILAVLIVLNTIMLLLLLWISWRRR